MQACQCAVVSKRGSHCDQQIGLVIVNRHIATAAPFTVGARSMDRSANCTCPLRKVTTNAPRVLIDAELAQRPQRHELNTMDDPESLSLALPDGTKVSALLRVPEDARALYVFAHGAGAGMRHAGMSPHCATSFRTWSGAPGGWTRRPWHMLPCRQPSQRPAGGCQPCRSSRAAGRSAAA